MYVKLHKSRNAYKKIATSLKIPISTIRAILKTFKATVTVTNLPGRVYFPPLHRGEDGKRGKKKIPKHHCWRITQESSILGSARLQNYP